MGRQSDEIAKLEEDVVRLNVLARQWQDQCIEAQTQLAAERHERQRLERDLLFYSRYSTELVSQLHMAKNNLVNTIGHMLERAHQVGIVMAEPQQETEPQPPLQIVRERNG